MRWKNLTAFLWIWAVAVLLWGCMPKLEKTECYQDKDCLHLGSNFTCDVSSGRCRQSPSKDTGKPLDAQAVEPGCMEDELLCLGRCVDPQTDRYHCGGCVQECDAGEICTDGVCALSCGGGTPLLCGDRCVDPLTDRLHSGECDKECPPGEFCSGGVCGLGCGGWTPNICGDECVNLDHHNSHCGACFEPCGSDEACCMGGCENIAFQAKHCGGCAHECQGSTPDCCSRLCVNLSADLQNCGSCGHSCPFRNNASRTCVNGNCGYDCNANYRSCDDNHNTGCETIFSPTVKTVEHVVKGVTRVLPVSMALAPPSPARLP